MAENNNNKLKKDKKAKKDKLPLSTVIKYNMLMLKKIGKMTPQYIVFMVIVGIVGGISNSISKVLTYKLFNAFDLPDVTFAKIAGIITLIFGIGIANTLFYRWYYQYYQPIIDKKLQHRMHAELFEHALKMDLACYDDPKFYNDYVWAMDESKGRAVQVLGDVADIITHIISLSTLITLMIHIDIIVGFIILAGCVADLVTGEIFNKLNFKKNEKTKPYHRRNSYINRLYHLSDYAKELRISSVGDNLQSIYADSVNNIVKEEVATGKKRYPLAVINDFSLTAAKYIPMILLILKLYNGTAQLGGFVASLNIIWDINWAMYDLSRKIIKFPDNAQYVSKYLKFLEYKPKIVSGSLKAEPLETIELKNLSFTYQPVLADDKKDGNDGTKPADEEKKPYYSLDGINLTIRKGEKIAIVGYNGAGKTTLTKLLMRLYDPTSGEILYNGKNLKEYDIPSIREKIGTVFQDYKIFAATIAENVLGSKCGEADRENVAGALEKATFGDKLCSLEKGMDTELTKEFSDDGVNLSGGEAQKVAIARIFARPYDLIIMDEPSSALDPVAEYELNHTILDYTKDKTVIFISHRLSTTRMADRILMFDSGHLVESGSHDELMAINGKYAEMFRLQAEKYRKSTPA